MHRCDDKWYPYVWSLFNDDNFIHERELGTTPRSYLVRHTVKSHIVNPITKSMVFASDLNDDDNRRYSISNLTDDRGNGKQYGASYLSWGENNRWGVSLYIILRGAGYTYKMQFRHAHPSVDTSWNDLYSLVPIFRESLLKPINYSYTATIQLWIESLSAVPVV